MSKLSKIAVVLGLVLSLGAHWAVLQSVAWVSMFVRHSQQSSLSESWTKTFDGRHPCMICIFVATGKRSNDQQANQVLKAPQMDLFVETPAKIVVLKMDPAPFAQVPEFWSYRFEQPPFPPPRLG